MTILLTGAAGYIGSHTAIALAEAGYDVAIVDDFSNSSPEAVRRCEALTGKKMPLYEADVADKTAMARIFAEQLGDVSYDPEHFCLRNGSVRYSLGDVVTVRVANVDRRACKIDFDIILPNAKRSAK